LQDKEGIFVLGYWDHRPAYLGVQLHNKKRMVQQCKRQATQAPVATARLQRSGGSATKHCDVFPFRPAFEMSVLLCCQL